MKPGEAELRRALDVFERVADLADGARHAALDALCAGEPALRELKTPFSPAPNEYSWPPVWQPVSRSMAASAANADFMVSL